MTYSSIKYVLAAVAILVLAAGCAPTPDQLKKIIKENPDIVFDVIKEHPFKFTETFREAAQAAQAKQREQAQKKEEDRREEEYKNPKNPEIQKSRAIWGKNDAPITIVEYSDFQCPFCSRGYRTVKEIKDEYGDKIRVVFKHLPLDFHPMAMPAAQMFEAIAKQSSDKAYKFHDLVFENQGDLKSGGEKLLLSLAGKAGADVNKMKTDMKSEAVKKIIEADMEEARKFGISGTPGFIVAGITLKGAYPAPAFKEIIDRRLKETGKN